MRRVLNLSIAADAVNERLVKRAFCNAIGDALGAIADGDAGRGFEFDSDLIADTHGYEVHGECIDPDAVVAQVSGAGRAE